jgi:hypothetical protein
MAVVLATLAGSGIAVGFAATGGGTPRHTDDVRLIGILRRLNRALVSDSARFQHATSATAQGTAAIEVAGAYRTAARQLATLPRSPHSVALARDVSNVASQFLVLARAARKGDRASYRRAAARALTGEARIRATARHL